MELLAEMMFTSKITDDKRLREDRGGSEVKTAGEHCFGRTFRGIHACDELIFQKRLRTATAWHCMSSCVIWMPTLWKRRTCLLQSLPR